MAAFANAAAFATEDGLVVVDTSSPFLCAEGARRRSPAWRDATLAHRDLHARPHRPRLRRGALRAGRPRPRPAPRPRSSRTSSSPPASTATWRPPGTTRSSTSGSSAPRSCSGRPSTATPTRRTATASTSTSAASTFELHHARGETDDHTWVWVPGTRTLCTGRPVHLGVAELRQPAEGPALRQGVGARAADDGRRSSPRCCSPGTGCRSSAPTVSPRRSPTPRCSSRRCTTRRSSS